MPQTTRDVSQVLFERARERRKDPKDVWGIPWGIRTLDAWYGGIHREQMTVIGARPKVGKTAFLCQVSIDVALWVMEHAPEKVVKIILTEMSAEAVQQRMAIRLDAIEVEKLTKEDPARVIRPLTQRRIDSGRITDEEFRRYKRSLATLADLPIEWEAEPISPDATRRWLEDGGNCAWWALDYLQRHPTGMPDLTGEDTKGAVLLSHRFANIAKEVAPGLVLSSLNRKIDERPDHRPMLSDLYGSAAIEHDAHMIAFLHRPDMYEKQAAHEREDAKFVDLIVAASRNGAVGDIKLLFSAANWSFADITKGVEE